MGPVEGVRENVQAVGAGGATPGTDPRTKPELVEVLRELGLDGLSDSPQVDADDFDAVLEFAAETQDHFETVYEDLPNELPGDSEGEKVTVASDSVEAPDGHRIELRICRPKQSSGELPAVLYIHGGGMTILKAFNKVHRRWGEDIAAAGTVSIGVDFRCAYSPEGALPFPTGLEDCLTAVRWVDAHRAELGISKIVLTGESGGGNLVLATALLAKREGLADLIDGVYALVPYISGIYGWEEERRRQELPSLVDLDGYLITAGLNALLARIYDPTGENAQNPLCWPYHATPDDLAGLPPHVISVNELDPLCDEGIAYLRKLQHAGVPAVGRVNLGLIHAAEMIFRQAVPEDYFAAVGDIHRFATSL